MASPLAVCVSILIIAALFLASAVASLFLKNHRPPAQSRNSRSPSRRYSERSRNGSFSLVGKPKRSKKKGRSSSHTNGDQPDSNFILIFRVYKRNRYCPKGFIRYLLEKIFILFTA
ncbi:MAG: hypothetical protein MHMPM18_003997 [Marteilia pararefringens]